MPPAPRLLPALPAPSALASSDSLSREVASWRESKLQQSEETRQRLRLETALLAQELGMLVGLPFVGQSSPKKIPTFSVSQAIMRWSMLSSSLSAKEVSTQAAGA